MNIIVITIDTQRWDHFGYNRRTPPLAKAPVITPNVDRFAQRATAFDRCIVNSFPTVPHRMDCFTGMANFPLYDWERLPDKLVSLTEVLRDAGYFTATVADTTNFVSANITRGMHEIHNTHQPPDDRPKPEDIPFPVPRENIRQGGKQRQSQLAGMAHFKHEGDWWVAQTMKRAADWLQENAAPGSAGRDKWFLWVDTFEVHEVWHTPQYYVDLYDANYEGLDYDFPNYGYTDIYTKKELKHLWAHYAAEVTLTDRWLGHLFDQIDVMGLWDDTMVVLTSDHGMYIGEHNRTGKHTVLGAEDPWPLYEEVSHVPLLVWVPKGKGLKRRVGALAQPADIMPTILEAAGVKGPRVFGRSLLPLMTDQRAKNWDVVFSSKHNSARKRLSICPTWLTATTPQWTCIAAEPGHKAELYDIKADPLQKRDLARKRPDICAKLQRAVVDFMREAGADDEYVARFASAAP